MTIDLEITSDANPALPATETAPQEERQREPNHHAEAAVKGKDWWDKLGALTPLITGVVLAILGYFLNDSVNAAFKRQELQLSNAKEMRDLLTTLDSGTSANEADVAALTLAAFGPPAVGPLVTTLFAGGDIRRPAAEKALRAVGLSDPQAVCGPMIRILDNHTGRFSWLTHLTAVRLIGDLECQDAGRVLTRYRTVLQRVNASEVLPALTAIVSDEPPADLSSAQQLTDELDRTLRILDAHRSRWWRW